MFNNYLKIKEIHIFMVVYAMFITYPINIKKSYGIRLPYF